MAVLADVGGFRPRAIPVVPYWGLAALAGCGECRSWLTRRHPYPSLQHARLNRYYWFYRSDRARANSATRAARWPSRSADTLRWFRPRKTLRPRGAGRWWMRPAPAGRAA